MRTYFIIFNSFSCIQCINTDFGLQLHDSLSETIYHGFIYCLKMLRRKCYSLTKHTNTTLWLFVKHMYSVTSKIPKKLWNCKKTCSATTNLVFRCGEATRDEQTCPFTTAVTLQPERERERDKKGQRTMKTMYPVPQSHVLQSPAFSLATSAFGQVYVASATTFDLHGETSVWGKG